MKVRQRKVHRIARFLLLLMAAWLLMDISAVAQPEMVTMSMAILKRTDSASAAPTQERFQRDMEVQREYLEKTGVMFPFFQT